MFAVNEINNTSNMEIIRLIIRINNFLKMFKDQIFPEHIKYLEDSLKYFCKRMADTPLVSNVYGQHFTSCCWAQNNVTHGVDTCACHFYTVRSNKCLKIMKMYINLEHRF